MYVPIAMTPKITAINDRTGTRGDSKKQTSRISKIKSTIDSENNFSIRFSIMILFK